MAGKERSGPSAEETRIGWQLAGLGFEIAGTVAAGALLGWLYDRWRGAGSTGMLVGSLAGVAVGLFTLIRNALRLNRRLEAMDRRRREARKAPPSPPPPSGGAGTDTEDEEDDWDRRWREQWDDDEPDRE